jgi:hypothetical protein
MKPGGLPRAHIYGWLHARVHTLLLLTYPKTAERATLLQQIDLPNLLFELPPRSKKRLDDLQSCRNVHELPPLMRLLDLDDLPCSGTPPRIWSGVRCNVVTSFAYAKLYLILPTSSGPILLR